jgi:hypothetical protein
MQYYYFFRFATARSKRSARRAHLLHNTSFALGEGNVPTRLVLDELDLNLSPLATGLVVVIVVVVCCAGSRPLDAAVRVAGDSIPISDARIIMAWGRILVVFRDFAGHGFVEKVLSSGYDELGTLFDLNSLRSSAFVWGFPFWRRAARRRKQDLLVLGAAGGEATDR